MIVTHLIALWSYRVYLKSQIHLQLLNAAGICQMESYLLTLLSLFLMPSFSIAVNQEQCIHLNYYDVYSLDSSSINIEIYYNGPTKVNLMTTISPADGVTIFDNYFRQNGVISLLTGIRPRKIYKIRVDVTSVPDLNQKFSCGHDYGTTNGE